MRQKHACALRPGACPGAGPPGSKTNKSHEVLRTRMIPFPPPSPPPEPSRKRAGRTGRRRNAFTRHSTAVKMAAAACLPGLPVILLLLGAQPSPLSLFGIGPAPVAAGDRSKWHIPIPSVSVQFGNRGWRSRGVGLRRPAGPRKVPPLSAARRAGARGVCSAAASRKPTSSLRAVQICGPVAGVSGPLQPWRGATLKWLLSSKVRQLSVPGQRRASLRACRCSAVQCSSSLQLEFHGIR